MLGNSYEMGLITMKLLEVFSFGKSGAKLTDAEATDLRKALAVNTRFNRGLTDFVYKAPMEQIYNKLLNDRESYEFYKSIRDITFSEERLSRLPAEEKHRLKYLSTCLKLINWEHDGKYSQMVSTATSFRSFAKISNSFEEPYASCILDIFIEEIVKNKMHLNFQADTSIEEIIYKMVKPGISVLDRDKYGMYSVENRFDHIYRITMRYIKFCKGVNRKLDYPEITIIHNSIIDTDIPVDILIFQFNNHMMKRKKVVYRDDSEYEDIMNTYKYLIFTNLTKLDILSMDKLDLAGINHDAKIEYEKNELIGENRRKNKV